MSPKAQMRDVETLSKAPLLGPLGSHQFHPNPTGGPLGDPQLAVSPLGPGVLSGTGTHPFRPLPLPPQRAAHLKCFPGGLQGFRPVCGLEQTPDRFWMRGVHCALRTALLLHPHTRGHGPFQGPAHRLGDLPVVGRVLAPGVALTPPGHGSVEPIQIGDSQNSSGSRFPFVAWLLNTYCVRIYSSLPLCSSLPAPPPLALAFCEIPSLVCCCEF